MLNIIWLSMIILSVIVGIIQGRIDAVVLAVTDSAKLGFDIALGLTGIMCLWLGIMGIAMKSGLVNLLSRGLAPVMKRLFPEIPPDDLLPLALIRPFSGSAATGVMATIIHEHGGNSSIAKTAATMMGGTETTFYVIAVYFGAVNIRRTRHAIPAGLLADLAGIIAAVTVCRYLFSS